MSLNGSQLTITGKREEEAREEGERYYAVERRYDTFARSFSLPDGVDAEHVAVELKNGILTVTIPKKPEAEPRKINLGKTGGAAKA